MTDVVVGRLADFPDGTHRVVEAAGRQIGVFNIGGRASTGCRTSARTRPARCARAAPSPARWSADAEGDWKPRWVMEGEVIACPWHGLEYHVPTGRCLAYPEITLRRYAVAVRGDEVVVTVGGRRA